MCGRIKKKDPPAGLGACSTCTPRKVSSRLYFCSVGENFHATSYDFADKYIEENHLAQFAVGLQCEKIWYTKINFVTFY